MTIRILKTGCRWRGRLLKPNKIIEIPLKKMPPLWAGKAEVVTPDKGVK